MVIYQFYYCHHRCGWYYLICTKEGTGECMNIRQSALDNKILEEFSKFGEELRAMLRGCIYRLLARYRCRIGRAP